MNERLMTQIRGKAGLRCILAAAALAAVISLVPQTTLAQSGVRMTNGIYAVERDSTLIDQSFVGRYGYCILRYDGKYVDSTQLANPRFVTVDTSFYVPLILAEAPETAKDGHGRTLLGVTLEKRYTETLEKFSRKHLGGLVAIVLDGEVITMHKVRSVITGGRLQITRCYDDACEVLKSKLVSDMR